MMSGIYFIQILIIFYLNVYLFIFFANSSGRYGQNSLFCLFPNLNCGQIINGLAPLYSTWDIHDFAFRSNMCFIILPSNTLSRRLRGWRTKTSVLQSLDNHSTTWATTLLNETIQVQIWSEFLEKQTNKQKNMKNIWAQWGEYPRLHVGSQLWCIFSFLYNFEFSIPNNKNEKVIIEGKWRKRFASPPRSGLGFGTTI